MKKLCAWFLISIITITSTLSCYSIPIFASDVDLGDDYILTPTIWETIRNAIFKEVGIGFNLGINDNDTMGTAENELRAKLISKGKIVTKDGVDFYTNNLYNGDTLQNIQDVVLEMREFLQGLDKQENQLLYISGKNFNEQTYISNMRYLNKNFTYTTSLQAVYKLMEQFPYTCNVRAAAVGEVLFYGFDTSAYKYAYLDNDGYIRLVDKDLNPSYGATFYNSVSPIQRTKSFTYDELLIDYTNLSFNFDGRYKFSDNTPFFTSKVQGYMDVKPWFDETDGNYYLYNFHGVMPVFSNIDALLNYVNNLPSYYTTSNFYSTEYNKQTINNVSLHTDLNLNNTLKDLELKIGNSLSAEEMQKIIDDAINRLIDNLPQDNPSSGGSTVNIDLTDTNNILTNIDNNVTEIDQYVKKYLYDNYQMFVLTYNDLKKFLYSDLDEYPYLGIIVNILNNIDNHIYEYIFTPLDNIYNTLSDDFIFYFNLLHNDLLLINNTLTEGFGDILQDEQENKTFSELMSAPNLTTMLNIFLFGSSDIEGYSEIGSINNGIETLDYDSGHSHSQITSSTIRSQYGGVVGTICKKFPFCIPFDMYDIVSKFAQEPSIPKFEIPFNVRELGKEYTISIDLSDFDALSTFARGMFTLFMIYGMIVFTKKNVTG